MSSSFLVPFTLSVRLSASCGVVHDGLGGLLSLLRCGDENTKMSVVPYDASTNGDGRDSLRYLLDESVGTIPLADAPCGLASADEFVSNIRRGSVFEQAYISLIFQEYCKRMEIDSEWKASLAGILGGRPLPSLSMLLDSVVRGETSAREELRRYHDSFVKWMNEMIPQWLGAVRNAELSRRNDSEAIEAAHGQLEVNITRLFGIGEEESVGHQPLGEVRKVEGETLRSQAITLIEREQSQRRQVVEAKIAGLVVQEEELRQQIEEGRQLREAEERRYRKVDMEGRWQFLAKEEESLRQRLAARESERQQLLEHIEAEEKLISQRLASSERKRAQEVETRERLEREQRELYREHVEAEEELLRERLRRHEEARKREAEEKDRRKEQEREELYEHVLAEEQLIRQRLERRKMDPESVEQGASYGMYSKGGTQLGVLNPALSGVGHPFHAQTPYEYQAGYHWQGSVMSGCEQPHYQRDVHYPLDNVCYQQQYHPLASGFLAQPEGHNFGSAAPHVTAICSVPPQATASVPCNGLVSHRSQGGSYVPQQTHVLRGNYAQYLSY